MCSDQSEFQARQQLKLVIHHTKEIIKKIIRYKQNLNFFTSPYELPFHFTHEGVSSLVAYKGSVIPIINELTGGLKRSMWYLGCKNIADIKKKSLVVTVTPNTYKDNIPRI
jgi:hypothetical protein